MGRRAAQASHQEAETPLTKTHAPEAQPSPPATPLPRHHPGTRQRTEALAGLRSQDPIISPLKVPLVSHRSLWDDPPSHNTRSACEEIPALKGAEPVLRPVEPREAGPGPPPTAWSQVAAPARGEGAAQGLGWVTPGCCHLQPDPQQRSSVQTPDAIRTTHSRPVQAAQCSQGHGCSC